MVAILIDSKTSPTIMSVEKGCPNGTNHFVSISNTTTYFQLLGQYRPVLNFFYKHDLLASSCILWVVILNDFAL